MLNHNRFHAHKLTLYKYHSYFWNKYIFVFCHFSYYFPYYIAFNIWNLLQEIIFKIINKKFKNVTYLQFLTILWFNVVEISNINYCTLSKYFLRLYYFYRKHRIIYIQCCNFNSQQYMYKYVYTTLNVIIFNILYLKYIYHLNTPHLPQLVLFESNATSRQHYA